MTDKINALLGQQATVIMYHLNTGAKTSLFGINGILQYNAHTQMYFVDLSRNGLHACVNFTTSNIIDVKKDTIFLTQ